MSTKNIPDTISDNFCFDIKRVKPNIEEGTAQEA